MTPTVIPIPSFQVPPNRWLSGIHNCHVPGLDSYVLRGRTSDKVGMLRVFNNTGPALGRLVQDNEYMVLPHNHRQDIRLIPVRGEVINVTFELDRRSHDHRTTEWVFESAILTGTASLRYHTSIDMQVRNIEPLPPEGVAIECDDVHTVIAARNAAWLIVEGELAPPEQKSFCYSRLNSFELDTKDLYQSMDHFQLLEPERMELLRQCSGVLGLLREMEGKNA